MKLDVCIYAMMLLVIPAAALPDPARYSKEIRTNWDKKGITYPGQKKQISEASHSQQVIIPLAQALISASFRQSMGQGAWGRTWLKNSRVRMNVEHDKEESKDSLRGEHDNKEATLSSRDRPKRPRTIDWQSIHSFSETSSSDKDHDWTFSSKEEQPSPEATSSDESFGETSNFKPPSRSRPSQRTRSKAELSETGSSSSIFGKSQIVTVDHSKVQKTYAEVQESKARHKVIFKKTWEQPLFSFNHSPLILAKNVRNVRVKGINDIAFRKMAGAFIESNALPKYATEYKYHAKALREDAERKRNKPHLPPRRIALNKPFVIPDITDGNTTRRRQNQAINKQVEEAVLEYLNRKRLDYRKMTLLQLEKVTRDFTEKNIKCSKKTLSKRINDLVKKWKKPTVIEWHAYSEQRKKYRNRKGVLARKGQSLQ